MRTHSYPRSTHIVVVTREQEPSNGDVHPSDVEGSVASPGHPLRFFRILELL